MNKILYLAYTVSFTCVFFFLIYKIRKLDYLLIKVHLYIIIIIIIIKFDGIKKKKKIIIIIINFFFFFFFFFTIRYGYKHGRRADGSPAETQVDDAVWNGSGFLRPSIVR